MMFNKREATITVEDFLYNSVVNYLGERKIKFTMGEEFELKYGRLPWPEHIRKIKARKFTMKIKRRDLDELYNLIDAITEYETQRGSFRKIES